MPQDGENEDVEQAPEDEQSSEQDQEQDADSQGEGGDQEDDDDGFDGPFDAKRARRTIDRLRRERNAARDAAKGASKDAPDSVKLQTENLRLRVALKVGLDDDLADRLRGSTEEELLEDAQKLLDRFYPAEKKLPTRQPKPNLRGGSRPEEEPELSADDIVKKALGR